MLGLRDALRGLGHSVAGMVSTAAEAVRQAESEKPDIILMDISLAGPMSGIEAADRIRQRLEIPVVFVTAHSDEATLRQAQAAEPYGFVLKPFDKNDLRIAIELAVYKHDDYWRCMDTLRDMQSLNEEWERGQAPWAVWRGCE